MKTPAPGTITHRLHGVTPGKIVTLTCVLGQPASYRRCDEEMAHLARATRYPDILAEIRARYGAPQIGSIYTTTTDAALAEAEKARAAA